MVSLGHHAANAEQISAAVHAGARLSTHLGNGAHAVLPRHPNYIWDQLAEDALWASIIVDGHHLPPSVVRCFVRSKGLERLILVSDAVAPGGLAPGRYGQMEREVELAPSGRLSLVGTPYLAGAALPLIDGVANLRRFADVSLADAVEASVPTPGRPAWQGRASRGSRGGRAGRSGAAPRERRGFGRRGDRLRWPTRLFLAVRRSGGPGAGAPTRFALRISHLLDRKRTMTTEPRRFTVDSLNVEVHPNRQALGSTAARTVAEWLRQDLAQRDRVGVMFASAPSQNEFLAALVEEPNIDWSRVVAFHLDEYVGLPADAPQGFAQFLRERLFDKVHPGVVHYLDGLEDPERACRRYADLLAGQPLAIACVGIGENGHLAFNDPHVADFADPHSSSRWRSTRFPAPNKFTTAASPGSSWFLTWLSR